MRKLSYSKIFKAVLLSLAPTLSFVRVTEIFESMSARPFSVHVV